MLCIPIIELRLRSKDIQLASMPSLPVVFLIDDHDAFSDSVVQLISSIGLGVERFASGGAFLQRLGDCAPGCVVIDLCKPHLDGMRVLDEIARQPLQLPTIVLTGQADVSLVVRAVHHGVVAFLEKQHASRTEILDAVQTALKLYSQRRAKSLRRQEIRARFAKLADPEQQVLHLLLQGDELVVQEKGL